MVGVLPEQIPGEWKTHETVGGDPADPITHLESRFHINEDWGEKFYTVRASSPDVALARAFALDEGAMDFEIEGDPDPDYLALAKMYCRIVSVA